MTTYSTMSLIFNPNGFVYYINEDQKFVEIKKDCCDVSKLSINTPFFYDDLYASNEFFQLFSEKIISFDELCDLHHTAYVKTTNNSEYPFFISFNPLFFFINYAFPQDENHPENKITDIKELIKNAVFSSKLNLKNVCKNKKEEIVQHFIESYEKKQWTFYGWLHWNNILLNNVSLARFITRVFVHEMYHILFGHLDNKLYGPEKFKYRNILNIAEDFVINGNICWRNDLSIKTDFHNYVFLYENVPEYFIKNSCTKVNFYLLFQFIEAYIKYIIEGKVKNEDFSQDQIKKFQSLYEKILAEKNKLNQNIIYNAMIYYSWMANKIYPNFSTNIGLEKNVNSTEFYYYILTNLNNFEHMPQLITVFDDHSNHFSEDHNENSMAGENNSENDPISNISKKIEEMVEDIVHKIGNKNSNKSMSPIHRKIVEQIFESRNFPYRVCLSGLSVHKWKKKLQHFISQSVNEAQYNVDITFKKENRRIENLFINYIPSDTYDFILVVDVSPSISDEEYKEFINEIKKIGREFNINKVRLIEFNSGIVLDKKININKFENYIPKQIPSSTDLECVFKKLKETNNRKPIVVFTDGYFPYFNPLFYNFKHLLYISCSSSTIENISNVLETLHQYHFNTISKFS